MSNEKNKKKTEITGWIIIGIIFVIIISAIIAGKFFRNEEKLKTAFRNGRLISVVFFGVGDDKLIKGATVCIYNPKTNKIANISIPVKTYTYFGKSVSNTIEESLIKNNSYDNLKTAVEKLLNIKNIDYYVFINKNNFVKFVDMIGGVEIFSSGIANVEKKVNIPEGLILLDGDKSFEYLSYFSDNKHESIYEQLKRTQIFFNGLYSLKDNFLDCFNDHIVTNYLYKLFITNMTKNDFLIFYNEIKKVYKTQKKDFSVGSENVILYCDKKTNIPKYDFILFPKKNGDWIKSEVKEAISNINKNIKIDDSNKIAIEIQNGTEIVGLGIRTRKYLETFGFNILDVNNADHNSYKNTVIVIRNSEQKALKLADLIRCKKIIKSDAPNEKKFDVTLILGKDFDGNVVK